MLCQYAGAEHLRSLQLRCDHLHPDTHPDHSPAAPQRGSDSVRKVQPQRHEPCGGSLDRRDYGFALGVRGLHGDAVQGQSV